MSALLELVDVETSYGASQVLFGMHLTVREGELITLMGRNGMGKTTTVRSITGLTPTHRGRILFHGKEIQGQPSFRRARAGLGLVPEGRRIFPNLSVQENLVATARDRRKARSPWTLKRIYSLFPRLEERSANMGSQLSGGEQQMLAIGRALMTNPVLLILDEATEGLAPLIREEIWSCLATLKKEGHSILLIDKNVDALLELADRHFVIEKGQVVWNGDTAAFVADPTLQERYLGV